MNKVSPHSSSSYFDSIEFQARLKKRYRAEKRFKFYGLTAIIMAFVFLIFLLACITAKGYTGFYQTYIQLPVTFDETILVSSISAEETSASLQENLMFADFQELVRQSLLKEFPDVTEPHQKRALFSLLSRGAGTTLKKALMKDDSLLNTSKAIWLPASSNVDMYIKGRISDKTPESQRKLKDKQLAWIKALESKGLIKTKFNILFFTASNSREPELAGIFGSVLGSLYTILACLIIAFPLGVLTAVYLEEFAPKNFLTDLIEININNLAAIPSIVFGLLGLALYLDIMELPRSASVVGGLTLALMVLPIMVITARNSLRAVPPSIRDAAMGLGASKIQTTFHHVVPLAMPGIMTGTILSIARALGETAPLIMIGMVAFVVDVPQTFFDPAAPLPVQIFTWADSAELGFVEKTSAAIMILLAILIVLNTVAAIIRKKYENKW
ncbi:MAG: phosphate ABC transporter permease PstA [Alphaproteobacteria bacterium]|nr:phosphate ABC transporter permease PstA [Alphaproteobacteria bacterium]